jgi:hypothetical protein
MEYKCCQELKKMWRVYEKIKSELEFGLTTWNFDTIKIVVPRILNMLESVFIYRDAGNVNDCPHWWFVFAAHAEEFWTDINRQVDSIKTVVEIVEKAREHLAFMRRLLELMEESCFYLSFYKDCEKEKGGEESGGGGV